MEEKTYGKEKTKQKEHGHILTAQKENQNQWMLKRNKYKKDRYDHIVGEISDKVGDI